MRWSFQLPWWLRLFYKDAVWRKSSSARCVYLTFDDGPVPEVTPQVLDILDRYRVKATFFWVGENVARYPDLAREVVRRGHSVGNHTYNHLAGWGRPLGMYADNVLKAEKAMDDAGVKREHKLFRPPYGKAGLQKHDWLRQQGYTVVLWDIITHDYNPRYTPAQIERAVLRYVRNGIASAEPDPRFERQMDKTGFETHDEYIRALYAAVPLKVISFDMYPILSFKPLEDGDFRLHGQRVFLKERWYETLETTSAFAAERGIPMFAFALLSAHRHYPGQDYPVPTMEHFRLQQYSNLAYGAQGLEYFRWYIKEPYHGYNSAPILYDGKRGPMFERVREFNAELQARAYVFVGAKVVKVRHAGIDIPLGTKRFEEKDLPSFVTAFSTLKNGEAVVSYLKNGGRDYFMVVNRSPNDDMAFTAKFAPGAEIVRRDGSRASLDAYSDVFWLDPGDAAIFTQATQTNKGTGR